MYVIDPLSANNLGPRLGKLAISVLSDVLSDVLNDVVRDFVRDLA